MGDERSQFARRPQFSFASHHASSSTSGASQRSADVNAGPRHRGERGEGGEAAAGQDHLNTQAPTSTSTAAVSQPVFAIPEDPRTPNPPLKRRRVFHHEAVSPTWLAHATQSSSSSRLFAAMPRFDTVSKTGEPSPQASGGAEGLLLPSTPMPRTRFVLPSEQDPDSSSNVPALLPDAFSPHRRKERFIPGGWASQTRMRALDASMQQGIASSTLEQAMSSSASSLDDETVTARVLAVRGAGDGNSQPPILSRCTVMGTHGQDMCEANILLVGPGERVFSKSSSTQGKTDAMLRSGSVIRLQSPLWDIHLRAEEQEQGEAWVVCSAWRLVHEDET